MEKISIPGVKHILILPADSITRVEARGNYCKIFLTDGKELFYAKLLCWFEQRLPQNKFVRVNRGQLINKNFVSEIWGRDCRQIKMENGDCIMVSRRRKSRTRKAMAA